MFSLLILMMLVPLMSLATKKQPVGGGQCFKRDWMAQCISYSVWKITNEASEILTVSFGSIETWEKEGLLEKKSTKNEYSYIREGKQDLFNLSKEGKKDLMQKNCSEHRTKTFR